MPAAALEAVVVLDCTPVIEVVTKFLFVSADTDLTNVSVEGEAYPVTTVLESLLFQAAPPPVAEALEIPVATCTFPVPEVLSVSIAIVG
ncbi:MAG: hypothetical protein IJH34_04870 [Romboutsia sp.]|nr:hypothetical protein [Romboutsia sp.]